ncbi:HGxxPAAW family protein [Arthrobacter halodurans]|uniref:HGxxPAAW family protein n=1 Tax=Arthrobacter halodurans TaxID=516699 RepID=A0ABV4UPF4_9MICC
MASKAAVNNEYGIDPMHAEAVGHGNSVAAWSAVGVMLVGVLVGCIGFGLANTVVLGAGAVIVVLGLVVGWFMKRIGYGVGGSKSKDSDH